MAKKTAVKKQSRASRVKVAMAASSDLLLAMHNEKLQRRVAEMISEFGDVGIYVIAVTNSQVTSGGDKVRHADVLLGIESVKWNILHDYAKRIGK